MNNPIFILGMVRSGTTLLRSILDNHPSIFIPRETSFFYLIEEYKSKFKIFDTEKINFNEFWNWYKEGRRFTYLELDEEEVKRNFQLSDKSGVIKIFDSVMLTNMKLHSKVRWGEKTPGHESYLKEILHYYPNSKLIFVIRDPRAIYASLNNVPWGKQFVSVVVKRWNNSVKYLKH